MMSAHEDLLTEIIAHCGFPESDIRLYTTFLPLGEPISPASTIQGFGRVLIGSYPLIKDQNLKVRTARALASFKPEELNRLPLESSSPLGFVLALNPVKFFKSLIAALADAATPSAVLDEADWNPVHVLTIGETLQLVNSTCIWNWVTGTNENTRSAVLSRIRAQFRHLYSDYFDQSEPIFRNDAERMACTAPVCTQTFLQNRLLALRTIERREAPSNDSEKNGVPVGKSVWEKIPGNWYLTSIPSRASPDQSLLQDLSNLRNVPSKQRAFLYASVVATVENDALPEIFIDARAYRKLSKKSEQIPSLSRTRSPGRGATHCPSPEIAMELVETCLNNMPEAGPAAILCTITGAVPPDKLHPALMEILDNSTVIRTTTKLVNIPVPTDLDLHRPTSLTFTSVTTREIGTVALDHLSKMSAEQLQREADNWLKRNPRFKFTFKGFCQTLRYNFPLWMDLPAVYYDIGLRNVNESMPGWRHYINYRLADFGSPVAQFIESYLDPSFQLPEHGGNESCGSAFCPEPEQVRAFYSRLVSWLIAPLPSDRASQIAMSNAIAAGCRLAETLLTFTRGRDDFSPLPQNVLQSPFTCKHKPDIRHEKKYPRVIYYPRALIEFLAASNRCLLRIAESTASIPSPSQIGLSYWFLAGGSQLFNIDYRSKIPPYRLLVSSALNQHEQTRNLAFLHPHGMRNLSNLILRRDRVLGEDAVLAIHDHYPNRAHSSLEFDCLQNPIMETEREKAADHLCKCLGLGDFVKNEK